MKTKFRFITTIFVFSISALFSTLISAATSVHHSHSGRVHSHPLPQQGLAHKHGALGFGVAIQSPTNTPKQSLPATHLVKKHKLVHGDPTCNLGDSDCNTCAANVQQQFQKVINGKIRWRNKPWRFNWPQPYPPNNLRPLDIFDGEPVHALGIPDAHIQGFVRTHSSRFPYAGSHSHKRRGGIFIVNQLGDGKKYLDTLHLANTRHPSGVHILGKYLVYGENNTIVFKDLNSPNHQQNITLKLPASNRASFGGGLGVTKLSKDRYLLVTTGPGGQDSRARYNRFYYLKSNNGRPFRLSFINQSTVINPKQWPKKYRFSENLSLITECGTGDIYAIHTSGDENGIRAVNGNGYWRLSKLIQQQDQLSFRAINAFANRQNMASCNVRSAATAFVNPHHQIELYCHAYAKDPDGSAFNVLGQSNSKADKFYFRVGIVQ